MTPDAPSFTFLPGDAGSPVILHVPHSAREIPAEVRAGIVLDDGALERELDHITDAHTARIAEEAARLAGATPWRFVNRLSRLVVDPERFPDEREEMRAVGMGAVYTRTTHREPLRPEDTDPEPLLARYFRPYARAMAAAVGERLAAVGRVVVIDVHSYPAAPLPYELHGDGPRPAVCLGADGFHTPPELAAAARTAFGKVGDTGFDSPFAGTYVPLEYYGKDARVSALMVEIRRDAYMSEPGGPAGPGLTRLASALAALVDAVTG
ncbi:N-formylglutamate amidohydrolase [Streptomyces sp. NPDC054884]|uniref:N-formylglutamate amidohydrolase n=1 Tax=Streptomyces sp. ME08-AFT2 TaxID=3028683 RepID=UPI0029B7665F|nr:N-formylglutamate amidohydrolase [Streptomyces sp. ME08-AFT2]MDX3313397.1 N-formylglutamate amidohydrolase [Streptomyces sp. ME08-AFT2]